MVSLFSDFGSIIFWPKTMDYNKAFWIAGVYSCFTHNSSLEGAMKLKFVPFPSS